MNAMPRAVQTSHGRTFHLTKEIGKGGEGAIYEAAEAGDLAFKLYWPDKAQTRREKITAMAAAEWYKTNPFVAFPIDAVFANGAFVGFVMRKVGGHKPIHLLYSPASRKHEFGRINFRFLVRSAGNVARAAASVHATGCIIGDVNESGFLVSDKAISILIDSDSFQVAAGQKRFLCQVGKPEYTPPELQGAPLDRTARNSNHDSFGLAVLIFQLLFMGKHPYAGRYSGREDMPIARAISEYRFAYSDQRAHTKMQPPPGAPLLSDFPAYIANAFEKAFGKVSAQGRPTSVEWVALLQNLEGELVQCTADNNHHHVKGKPCPWCRMEQSSPGFIAFGSYQHTVFIPTQIDAKQFYAILSSIPNPGAWPDFQTILTVPTNLAASATPSNLHDKLRTRAISGIVASAIGAILVCYGSSAILPGLCILGLGLGANALAPKELGALRKARQQTELSLRSVHEIWKKEAANDSFAMTKAGIDEKLRQLSDIPNDEKRGIQELEQRKRELQLRRHLDGFLIKRARINKIGSARKATLASYNIETAADIDAKKVGAIPGFGPGLVGELVAWQKMLAARFVFNPNEPTNPIDLASLKSKISARKAGLEKFLRDNLRGLQIQATQTIDQRKKLTAAANRAFEAVKQAELNEQAANGTLSKGAKFISFCCAGLAAIGLLGGLGSNPRPTARQPTSVATRVIYPPATPTPIPKSQFDTKVAPKQKPPIVLSIPVQPFPIPPAHAPQTPNEKLAGNQDGSGGAPSLPAPQEIPDLQSAIRSLGTQKLLDTALSEDTRRIQQRLIDLGFLTGTADGKWGPKSKQALADFRQTRQLGTDSTWDERTQGALFESGQSATTTPSSLPVGTPQAFFGGWTDTPGACGEPPDRPPLTIDATGASTFGGYCRFNSIRQEANNMWLVSARCTVGADSWPATIHLVLTSAGLRWSSEKGTQLYYRCGPRS
jgi:DNA-binding helix-hairpin-helix protein with protein kinase domain